MNLNFFEFYHTRFQDSKTRKWVIIGTLIYLFSPIDIIPDILLPFGIIDDTVLIIMFLSEILALFRKPKNKPVNKRS
jgi:uncharacterized membrane protein YkvA (DUF1232 family)